MVPPNETDPSPQLALPILAAGTTLLLGGLATLMGSAHLDGVLVTAGRRHYAYDFRFAGLLLLGFTITFAGILCLTAVRGLARARRPAWDRALIGTLLMAAGALGSASSLDGTGVVRWCASIGRDRHDRRER